MLEQRNTNQKDSDEMAAELMNTTNQEDLFARLNIRPPENFEETLPGGDDEADNRPPITLTEVDPAQVEERPTATGPDADTPENPDDTMTGYDPEVIPVTTLRKATSYSNMVNQAAAAIVNDKAPPVEGQEKDPEAAEKALTAAETEAEGTFENLEKMIEQSEKGMQEAPGRSTNVAIQNLITRTSLATMRMRALGLRRIIWTLQQANNTTNLTRKDLSGLNKEHVIRRAENDLASIMSLSKRIENFQMTDLQRQRILRMQNIAQNNLDVLRNAAASPMPPMPEDVEP